MLIRPSVQALVAVALGVLVASQFGTTGRADSVIIRPTRSFDLKNLLSPNQRPSLQVHGFAAAGSQLYFAVAQGPRFANPVIVVTDSQGTLQKLMRVPSGEYAAFDVDDSGNLFFIKISRELQSLIKIGPDGNLAGSWKVPSGWLKAFCVLGERLPALTESGALYLFSAQSAEIPPKSVATRIGPFPGPIQVAALTSDTMVIVDQLAGNLYLVEAADGSTQIFTPQSSLVPRSTSTASDSRISGTVLFPGLATSQDGYIYLAVGTYVLADGLPVLKLDKTGATVDTYRMLLAAEEHAASKDNPGGYFPVRKIGIAGRQLYGINTGGVITSYMLP